MRYCIYKITESIKNLKFVQSIRTFLTHTFLYDIIHGKRMKKIAKSVHERNVLFLKEGNDLFIKFCSTMNSAKIPYWMDFGTLLGYYRDNDFISHDCDLDFGAYIEDACKIKTILIQAGFTLVHEYYSKDHTGKEETYQLNHTTLDVFYYTKCEMSYYCYSFSLKERPFKNREIPCSILRTDIQLKGIKSVTFKGVQTNIPLNVEEILIANYGETYMTPDPHYSCYSAKNITIYSYEEKPGVAIFY